MCGRNMEGGDANGDEPVAFEQTGGTLTVTVPQAQNDSTDTIIELTFDKPVVGLKAVDGSKGNMN